MCASDSPFPGVLGGGDGPGYPVGPQDIKQAKATEGYTFELSLRRRRQQLRERQTRIEQKIQLLSELLRVFEED